MATRLDQTMMFTVHDAFRRDLDHLARVTERADDDPRHVLRTALGWELFKRHLLIHHRSEDAALWPALERELAGRPGDLALLTAMAAEHEVIDPLLALVDATLADRETGPERLGGAVEALSSALRAHLRHEERDALPLIDVTLPEEQWQAFGQEHGRRVGDGAPRYLPWVLEAARPERVAAVLGLMPPPLAAAYEAEWRPAYESVNRWPVA
jgi:iron-sulfur cluster repair protein YtfE (RIC family)